MANRCSSCNKLCSLETGEPEVELDIDGVTITANIRLVRSSECCGDEVKEATFEPSVEIDAELVTAHIDPETGEGRTEECELEVEEGDVEATERTTGTGRGRRTFYGASVGFSVKCACQAPDDKPLCEGSISDECQASHMEDLT